MDEKEYIERGALLTELERFPHLERSAGCVIRSAPAADVVEVRHGKWIHEPPYIAPNGKYLKASECSNCYAFFVSDGNEPYSDHPYCCECGAKMD